MFINYSNYNGCGIDLHGCGIDLPTSMNNVNGRNISTCLTFEGQPPVCISRLLTPRYNIAYIVISDNALSLIRSGIFLVSFRVPTIIVELASYRRFISSLRKEKH